ncbi:dihydrolipoyllysine-residue acetyltransferase [Salicola sp. Rm-C-2C1-2]|uniref:dihydrolipoyllysine-residue acetyltransferase n=1 Tax=Salicola sp. Rm-C-2C1-2 TaxID=3141321 RepID=UPI0032E509B5
MSEQQIRVPELGGAESVEIVGVLVSVGDSVNAEDPLLELESDKATVELPAPAAGKITRLDVKEGDSLKEGDLVGMMETAEAGASGDSDQSESDEEPAGASPARDEAQEADTDSQAGDAASEASGTSAGEQEIHVPELGGAESVEIVGVLVGVGDSVNAEDPLLELESDKATVEMPSPATGKITRLDVKVGDSLKEGDVVGMLEAADSSAQGTGADKQPEHKKEAPAAGASPARDNTKADASQSASSDTASGKRVHAGPSVRRIAREFGADLQQIQGSGPKGRILKEDVQAWVRNQLQSGASAPAGGGAGIPEVPLPDFSQFGEVERQSMTKIQRLTAQGMHRSWLNVPHVTQFEKADITDLEAFRKDHKAEGEKRGVKMTLLPFLMKACAHALTTYPQFNVSLDMANEQIIQKHYCHIGIAVDTPNGLVVPVIRDVDRKSIWQLAAEAQELAGKARDKKLTNNDMSGACFTITSLGGIGGTAFTPIVNSPEVAILGASKAAMEPVWDGAQFQPRLMLPLSLSYDHRAINGADAARFTTLLSTTLGDLRELLL